MREWLSGRALPCLTVNCKNRSKRASVILAFAIVKELTKSSQTNIIIITMREWLSGRALPCQGKCREFESRLPLQLNKTAEWLFFIKLNYPL